MSGGRGWQPDRRPGRRLFVAVPVAEPVRATITAIVDAVRDRTEDGSSRETRAESRRPDQGRRRELRWVRLDGIHLTVRFLGPTPDDQFDAVAAAVRETAAEGHPFRIRLGGAGGFPSAERPRALWLGVVEGRDELARLARSIDARLEPLGWPPDERPFRAHLTLARADGVPKAHEAVSALIEEARDLDAAWEAGRLVLFQSHTGNGPARYEPLVEASLGGE